ncbi:hypothetical protein [Desulfatitalea tepidiphila]|uniref:hypothetical protein n=1 Tax=Desulfatitalea tepidiphila TaxID=1185843 RepID=UPI0006B517FB|nr:hypothetical protein [Desulfatitalea tepidiphila]
MLINRVAKDGPTPVQIQPGPDDDTGSGGSPGTSGFGSENAVACRRDNGYRRFLPAPLGLPPQTSEEEISGDAPVARNRPPRPVPMGAPVKRPCPGSIPSRRRHLC